MRFIDREFLKIKIAEKKIIDADRVNNLEKNPERIFWVETDIIIGS